MSDPSISSGPSQPVRRGKWSAAIARTVQRHTRCPELFRCSSSLPDACVSSSGGARYRLLELDNEPGKNYRAI